MEQPSRPTWQALLMFLVLIDTALAILVAPKSSCAQHCGNNLGSTSTDELVCNEDQYSSTAGKVFSGCVECEMRSEWVYEEGGTTQSDLQWMLYNVRLASSYCLFGIPGGTPPSNPCITHFACEPLKDALTYGNVSVATANYNYCNAWDSDLVPACEGCLRAGDRDILSNLLTVLDAGCKQKPKNGQTISIEGDVFSSQIVNVTEPTPSLDAAYDTTKGFPIGGIVGIAVGSVVAFLLVVGFCIVCFGKRRRRAFLRQLEAQKNSSPNGPPAFTDVITPAPARSPPPVVTTWNAAASASTFNFNDRDINETPLSQRPLQAWDDHTTTSPLSATTTAADRSPTALTRYWSPYASPVSPDERIFTRTSPVQTREIGLAFGGEEDVVAPVSPQSRKGKERVGDEGGYELKNIPS